MYVVESLAPYAFTTHLKDMGVKEYEDGFLLSEVPLGTGVLDLRSIIDVCRKYNPNIIFNLEMITRNPLKIPCFTDQYWATFKGRPATDLVKAINWVRKNKTDIVLPLVEGKTTEEKLIFEERNVLASFKYANTELEI
jgi:L-ribulose-5-phosphate 3-epimerase UlaE